MIIGQDKFLPRWHLPNISALPQSLHLDLAYAVADKRDLRIDLLRGFAVFVMIVDHFGGASWLYLITGNNSFFVSGAEAFVFISGIVVGMVYGGIALQNLQSAQWKALERAWTLYKLTVALTLIFAVISKFFLLPWADAFRIDNPFTWLVDVVTLHRTFYLADVMLMYTVLMVGAVGALWLLIHHRTGVLLAASLGIWLAFQIAPAATQLPWHIEGNGTFNLAAWQLLFFSAMALGFHRERVAQAFRRLPRAPYFVLSGLLLVWLVQFYGANASPIEPNALMRIMFQKSALAPGRLLAGFIVFQFAYLAATMLWKPIWATLGWVLMPLGQNALYCYTMHVFVVSLVHIAFHYFPILPMLGTLNTLFQLAAILLIWVMIRKQFLFNIVPR
jgi:hypothetical protein